MIAFCVGSIFIKKCFAKRKKDPKNINMGENITCVVVSGKISFLPLSDIKKFLHRLTWGSAKAAPQSTFVRVVIEITNKDTKL